MNPTDFPDPLTLPLATPAGISFQLSLVISQLLTRWIGRTIRRDVHGPQMTYPNDSFICCTDFSSGAITGLRNLAS